MNQDPAFDASIPVLTEVVRDPVMRDPVVRDPAERGPAAPAVAATAPPAAPASAPEEAPAALPADWPAQLERRAIDRWSGAEWSVLERRVTERILQQLQGRIDFVFEQRLREGVTHAVEQALSGFAGQIQASVETSVRELVQRAVSSEITHIRNLGK